MIDLYTWSTPNGRKVSILLEELGIDYTVHPIDIGKDEQFADAFLKIAPNNKIPAIVDRETGASLFESGAIMIYLADKADRFLPKDGPERYQTLQWLMWQMGGFGPMLGQAHHFLKYNPGQAPYAEKRFGDETERLYGVLDRQLADNEYVAGAYSIADMAIWPWATRYDWQQIDLAAFPNVVRWFRSVGERPAVQAGYQVPNPGQVIPSP
ncbi:MAG: glutathione S-transferase N-terminal domain-containing protein [Pseudomonadota bacterium]